MKEYRRVLNEQLARLEQERSLIEEAIQEIHRRYEVLDDVESWGLVDHSDEAPSAFTAPVSDVAEEKAEEEERFWIGSRDEEFHFEASHEVEEQQFQSSEEYEMEGEEYLKSSTL